MTVSQLIEMLKKANQDVPVIMHSCYNEDHASVTGMIYNNDEVVLTDETLD